MRWRISVGWLIITTSVLVQNSYNNGKKLANGVNCAIQLSTH
jgi:hypothetical protein